MGACVVPCLLELHSFCITHIYQLHHRYGTTQFLSAFGALSTHRDTGTLQPQQFKFLLDQARVDSGVSYYHHTFVRVLKQTDRDDIAQKVKAWLPAPPTHTIRGQVPPYCRPPSAAEDEAMQDWITRELNIRWYVCVYACFKGFIVQWRENAAD